jgi:nucleoside-diphosphate-sugar epimerase
MPNDCLNPYSVTKVAGEDLCRMYYRLFNLNTIILRYFNVYGARQPLRGQYAPVVGIFLRQFFDNKPMTVVGDGEQRRDFTHVNDVVNANYLAATIENQNVFGETFNIGSGTSYSILDLVKIIGGEYKHIDERLGEARETLADIAKAQNLLGWEPTVELSSWLERSRNGELSW